MWMLNTSSRGCLAARALVYDRLAVWRSLRATAVRDALPDCLTVRFTLLSLSRNQGSSQGLQHARMSIDGDACWPCLLAQRKSVPPIEMKQVSERTVSRTARKGRSQRLPLMPSPLSPAVSLPSSQFRHDTLPLYEVVLRYPPV